MAQRLPGCRSVVASLLLYLLLPPQAVPAQSPAFDVASVEQNISHSDDSKLSSSIPDRFVVTNYPLYFLILYAYDLKGHQLIGAPDWTWDKSYNIIATYPALHPTEPEVRTMLQGLLAERFGLKLHTEQRDLPGYSLVLARKDGKLGPQLTASQVDCNAWLKKKLSRIDAGGPSSVSPSGKRPECMLSTSRKLMTGGAVTIQAVAGHLEALVDKPVADHTGLAGVYDIDLQWDPSGMFADRPSSATADAGPNSPSIFTALQEQVGLKLVPEKVKTTVFIVDQVKSPQPN